MDKEQFDILAGKAQAVLANARKVVVLTHMSPDGDAMGSSLAMGHWLKDRFADKTQTAALTENRQVTVIVPNAFPDFLAWMPGASDVVVYENDSQKADGLLEAADTVVCTDFNEPKRIGALGTKFLDVLAAKGESMNVVMIDHHLTVAERTLPDSDHIVKIIDPSCPSASELVYRVVVRSQMSAVSCQRSEVSSLDFATCVYTGMMTDTGNFSFNSNHPEMYNIISQLVAVGVDKDAVYDHIFNAWSASRIRLVGYCLYQKMRLFPEHNASLITLNGKELYRFHFKSGDAEGIVNMPLQISDVYYSCFMREDKVTEIEKAFANGSKTKIKISMRSQGDRPVNVFCREVFNGGGHKNASGGEYYGSLEDAVKLFLDNYPKYFK